MGQGVPDNSNEQVAQSIFLIASAMGDIAKRLEALGKDLMSLPQRQGLLLPDGVKQASIESLAVQGLGEDLAQTIFDTVVERSGISAEVIRGQSKKARLITVRQVAAYLIYRYTDLSRPAIALLLDRDHSTVFHSCKKVEKQITDLDSEASKLVREIVKSLGLGHITVKPERKTASTVRTSGKAKPKPLLRPAIPQGTMPHFVQPRR